ncbi:MAG: two-component regulator propeller domain-containing protein, partial [Ginsengibacter sp.]
MIRSSYKKYYQGHKTFCMLQWQCILLFFLFSSCFFAINAQQSSIKFTHLTNIDGLSQSTVQAMLKDKYGFMWFGTHDGLNR